MNTQVTTGRGYRRAIAAKRVLKAQAGAKRSFLSGLQVFIGQWVLVNVANDIEYTGSLVYADHAGLTLDVQGNGATSDYVFIPLTQVFCIAYQH